VKLWTKKKRPGTKISRGQGWGENIKTFTGREKIEDWWEISNVKLGAPPRRRGPKKNTLMGRGESF